ncbi:hypothetical protein DYB30_010463 [Aphanomyces astaci]|uniref:BTB domain-containing protein n=1 Tax=Aphanomyces astaci TaxID=112090 RepID=A0A397D4E7_APHAT|nr:hypothetical protein DYB30_010463 [Aphanomyces astaci]RHZ32945.1 hypothetical protein DYB31_010663 [Aphanomyces astaci]RHZ33974.1 hypothetical protein DYB26_011957 [Aphanomyces astaci]
MNRSVRADNVEFTVKVMLQSASEDLILTGSERSIIRVPANNMYSCLMQKTQRFSSLFRHYSKHHGLPRESHKCVLTTRCEVFRCMFPAEAKAGMKESEDGTVLIRDHSPDMVAKLLEFIYTNRVHDLAKLTTAQLIDLLSLGDQYLMRPLRDLCEIQAKELVNNESCVKLLNAAEKFNAGFLKETCVNHIVDNMAQLIDEDGFRLEIEQCPSLALVLLRAQHMQASPSALEPSAKRRRLTMPTTDDYDEYE